MQDIGCLRCCFRNRFFLQDEVVSLRPNPHSWRAVGLSLVWTLLLDLSGLGGPTRGVNTPAGIALGVTGTHKPLSHDKATVPVSDINKLAPNYLCNMFTPRTLSFDPLVLAETKN